MPTPPTLTTLPPTYSVTPPYPSEIIPVGVESYSPPYPTTNTPVGVESYSPPYPVNPIPVSTQQPVLSFPPPVVRGNSQSVPEPSFVLGFVFLALVTLVINKKRRKGIYS